MLMTPLLAGAMPDEQNLQAGLENKKAASCSGFRMGNRAAGCHFRPYSFASSPFDDFAEMKNSTRKIVCQPLSAPPLDGPRLPPILAFPKPAKAGEEAFRQPVSTRSALPKRNSQLSRIPAQNRTGRPHPRPKTPTPSRLPQVIPKQPAYSPRLTVTAALRPSLSRSNPLGIPTLRANCGAASPPQRGKLY